MTLIAVSRLATILHLSFCSTQASFKEGPPSITSLFPVLLPSVQGEETTLMSLSIDLLVALFSFSPFSKTRFHLFIGRFSSEMTPFSSLSRRTNKHNEDIESSLFHFYFVVMKEMGVDPTS